LTAHFFFDFAPALGLLLDAGLDDSDTATRADLVGYAAHHGAVACLQLLHERYSQHEWNQLLTPRPDWLEGSPLAQAYVSLSSDAVEARKKSGAFEYLLSFHSPGGASGPDVLPPKAVDKALAFLAAEALERTLPLQARLDTVRSAYNSWDTRTQIETVLVLQKSRSCNYTPLYVAARTNSFRVTAALFQMGYPPPPFRSLVLPTEATAEAVLDGLAAAEATESLAEAADAATRRQRTAARILRTVPALFIPDAARCVLLTSAAPDIGTVNWTEMLDSCRHEPNHALSLRIARATIEAAQATKATAATLNTLIAKKSWQLLSDQVRTAQVLQAQLLADNGADVFVTSERGESLLCFASTHTGSRPLPALKVAPPHIADPAVAAATASRMFASADAARAHAAAAAAEEERLFTAVHEDPDMRQRVQAGPNAWQRWAYSMNSVLSLRWVWQCMCERDPKRAHAYLQPSASELPLYDPLSVAIQYSAVRNVRFLTSLGARMTCDDVKYLAQSCLDGNWELAWALLDALPEDADERASILEFVTPKDGHTAFAGVALAVLDGHRFSPPLAEALLAAGATVPRTLLFALCDPSAQDRPVTSLPGELARALRWTLEHFQRTHSSCVF